MSAYLGNENKRGNPPKANSYLFEWNNFSVFYLKP